MLEIGSIVRLVQTGRIGLMSYGNHKRYALDNTKPFSHRASHARSCTLYVATQLHLPREEVVERVTTLSGVNLFTVNNGEDLAHAVACLDSLRLPPLAVLRQIKHSKRQPR